MRDHFNQGRRNTRVPPSIEYRGLGPISIDELSQALWEDLKALKDFYNISFVTGARLIIPPTNEWGDPVVMKHPDGRTVTRYDSHYYKPACLEYKL